MKTLPASRAGLHLRLAFGAGGVAIVAGGLIAAVNSATPFAHGSWLAAYLVLVAGVAQLALAAGAQALSTEEPAQSIARLRLTFWNLGNAVVATGVLAGAPVVVAVGSAALLAALGSFARSVGGGHPGVRNWAVAYQATVACLAVGTGIGCVLAGTISG